MSEPTRPSGFADVDRQQDQAFFLTMLEAQDRERDVIAARAIARTMLDPKADQRLLDVGCGTGLVACELADAVGPAGSVVGVDASELMLGAARTRAAGRDNIEFRRGDANALEFKDDSFDGARSERTFQHLEDPSRALAEMKRVVRSGGRIVVLDTDWESSVVDLEDEELAELMSRAATPRMTTRTVGRRLYRLFKQAGLADVDVVGAPLVWTYATMPGTELNIIQRGVGFAVEDGRISVKDAQRALEAVAAAEAAGTFFMSVTMFAVSGTKP